MLAAVHQTSRFTAEDQLLALNTFDCSIRVFQLFKELKVLGPLFV